MGVRRFSTDLKCEKPHKDSELFRLNMQINKTTLLQSQSASSTKKYSFQREVVEMHET